MEGKNGKKIGKQGCHLQGGGVQSSETSIKKEKVSTLPKSLQDGSDQDELIGRDLLPVEETQVLEGEEGARSDEHQSRKARGGKLLQD